MSGTLAEDLMPKSSPKVRTERHLLTTLSCLASSMFLRSSEICARRTMIEVSVKTLMTPPMMLAAHDACSKALWLLSGDLAIAINRMRVVEYSTRGVENLTAMAKFASLGAYSFANLRVDLSTKVMRSTYIEHQTMWSLFSYTC